MSTTPNCHLTCQPPSLELVSLEGEIDPEPPAICTRSKSEIQATPIPTIDPDDLIGSTFLQSPQTNGEHS